MYYIILLSSLFFLGSCGTNEEVVQSTTENTIAPTLENEDVQNASSQISEDVEAEKFKTLIESGSGLLLDVRTPGEFGGGHINGAINLDFNSGQFESSIDTLDKTKPVYVYCQGGGRSGQAKNILTERGFNEVYNLIGGYGNWPY